MRKFIPLLITDLSIPLAGIPIQVIRSYDSLETSVTSAFSVRGSLVTGKGMLSIHRL